MVPGRRILRAVGLARGSTVRANHVGDDVRAMLRSLFGGEIPELSQLLAAAREQALDRMIADALSLGADGVVAARMQSTILRSGASEVIWYGTAVTFAVSGGLNRTAEADGS